MAWVLDAEQAGRLQAIAHRRDLQRLGAALASAMPTLPGRLAARYDEFIALGASRAAAQGLSHLLCLGRYVACWAVLGGDFETRHRWAGALLADRDCDEGAKVFRLGVRTAEQLSNAPQSGQMTAAEFSQSLQHLDALLRAGGAIGSLLPRESIRLGSPCDLDALEISVVEGAAPPQHYAAADGQWSRVAVAARPAPIRLGGAGDAGAVALPPQLSLLGPSDGVAVLRLRLRIEHCCDAEVHPRVSVQAANGANEWRGLPARDLRLSLPPGPPEPAQRGGLSPVIAAQSQPQYGLLAVTSCGLRAAGPVIGALSTQIAVYPDQQHLMTWQREPGPPLSWPEVSGAPAFAPSRLRIERDGSAVDAARWQAGFDDLDRQLLAGLSRLATSWQRESGVTQPRVSAEPRVLCGAAGITWGWAGGPDGIATPAYHRVAGQIDVLACQLDLRCSGTLAVQGSSSRLLLGCAASAPLRTAWQRLAGQVDLDESLQAAQIRFSLPFTLALEPTAEADAALLGIAGPVNGALVGSCGLRSRADGAGLQWFAALDIEPVSVLLHWHDPLLGQQELQRPLLPALKLLDWSLG
jgi:hypothetical protein